MKWKNIALGLTILLVLVGIVAYATYFRHTNNRHPQKPTVLVDSKKYITKPSTAKVYRKHPKKVRKSVACPCDTMIIVIQ